MTVFSFIAKSASRNKRRALLTVLSVAVSLFLFVTLLVALREITMPPEDVGASLRIAVRNRISLANPLPARQLPIIEQIPGVVVVTPLTFFGGKYKNDEGVGFAQFGLDPSKMIDIFGEAKIPSDQLAAWTADRTSCIIGRDTAKRYGIKVGDKMTLQGTIYPVDIELKVAGIYWGTLDDRNVWFHQKYLDDALGNRGEVGMWWVRARSAEDVPMVVDAINKAFVNTSAEVRAETERAFQLSFVSMWGNIRILITSICSVVVFTLVLVTASTMSMAIRERFRELAVLKALGFQRGELFAFILAESFGLAMLGALIGVGGAWLAYTHMTVAGIVLGVAGAGLAVLALWQLFALRRGLGFCLSLLSALTLCWLGLKLYQSGSMSQLTAGILPSFEVTQKIVGQGLLVAVGLGIVSSLAPAFAVMRMSVVEGLKTLD